MNFYSVYEYVFPVLAFPLAYALWLQRYAGDHRLVVLMLSIPIIFAYVVPGIGTNCLRLWKFNSSLKWGRFRPHHGFLFGTAASLFALICLEFPPQTFSVWEILRSAFVLGSVLAFWNWLYDLYAIKAGFIVVYNRKYSERCDAESIASAYCPVFFGSFGFCYGATVRILEQQAQQCDSWLHLGLLFLVGNLFVLTCPVFAYVTYSLLVSGETGLHSYEE